jgi:hypothetical protein
MTKQLYLWIRFASIFLITFSVPSGGKAYGGGDAQGHLETGKMPRIIVTDDMASILGWSVSPRRENIESVLDGYTGQGIDVVSWDLVGGQLASYQSKVCELLPGILGRVSRNAKYLIDNGVDLPAAIAEASHRRGLQYWPAVRMNASARYPSRTHQTHPEWFLTGYQRGIGYMPTRANGGVGYLPMLNYELPEVRAYMMRAFRELVEDYDADGLLLNFLRYPSMFHPDRDIQSTGLLTTYIGEVRKMLDEVGRRKGRRLPLAVQVLARPNDGLRYGHDVRAWINKRYVDYVLPSRMYSNDCNLPVDQWLEMVRGTECRVFPTIHPNFVFPWTVENRSTLDSLRGAAHLYYGQGAHGLSTMNIFGGPYIQWLHALRNPDQVARGPHHYRYLSEPLASAWEALNVPVVTATWRVTIPIRIVDEPASLRGGVLAITVENIDEKVELEFTLNGKVIPKVERAGWAEYPRYATSRAKTFRFELPLEKIQFVKGENQLGFQLLAGGPDKIEVEPGRVAVTEVEMLVPSPGNQ